MEIDTPDDVQAARDAGFPVADPQTTEEVVRCLKAATERFVNNPKRKKEVQFIDLFMAAANYVRLVVEDQERRSGLIKLEDKRNFRATMVATINKGLMRRLQT